MKPKILLVDDEPNILDGLKRQLRGSYEVHTAEGGEQALATLKNHGPFEVVLADMRMPKMNGIELLTQIRAIDPKVVPMMLTGNADRQTAVDAVEKGKVFHFLTKPCSEEALLSAIEAGIKLFSLQGQIDKIDAYLKHAS